MPSEVLVLPTSMTSSMDRPLVDRDARDDAHHGPVPGAGQQDPVRSHVLGSPPPAARPGPPPLRAHPRRPRGSARRPPGSLGGAAPRRPKRRKPPPPPAGVASLEPREH